MGYNYLPLDDRWLSFEQIKSLLEFRQHISITFAAHERVAACREYLDRRLAEPGAVFYGVNTGFGFLQDVRIDADQTAALQYNLLKSHACGLGERVPPDIVRLMLAFKVKSLSYGHSGVQVDTVKRLMDLHNEEVLPLVFTQGSLGASGDLVPLSHLCLPLIGLGEVIHAGRRLPTAQVWKEKGWEPIALRSKEGLALINGTQFMTAYGMYILAKGEKLLDWADAICALSWDAFDCSLEPLHPRVHDIRPHKSQSRVAECLRTYLDGSAIASQHKKQVQDPYSFRCAPQVHGASRHAFAHVLDVFLTEVNSVTDNPNIFPEEDLILSGGNFHGQPLALALDYLAIALAEVASISERRVFQLLSGQRGLPLFLVKSPGLHSGFMIPQYTAAGIVSENKGLCTPASVDSITSSNGQEDHVSMGAGAATKCYRVLHNLEKVLAIELMTAAQALDFRRPARTSDFLEHIHEGYREAVRFNEADRVLHEDLVQTLHFLNHPISEFDYL